MVLMDALHRTYNGGISWMFSSSPIQFPLDPIISRTSLPSDTRPISPTPTICSCHPPDPTSLLQPLTHPPGLKPFSPSFSQSTVPALPTSDTARTKTRPATIDPLPTTLSARCHRTSIAAWTWATDPTGTPAEGAGQLFGVEAFAALRHGGCSLGGWWMGRCCCR